MLSNGSGADSWDWMVHRFGWSSGDGLSRLGKGSQPGSSPSHRSTALLAKRSGERRGSDIASCCPPAKQGAIFPPPTQPSMLQVLTSHHPNAIPTRHRRWPGPRANITLRVGVLELIQSLWCCLVLCLLVPSVTILEKAVKPGRAEHSPLC